MKKLRFYLILPLLLLLSLTLLVSCSDSDKSLDGDVKLTSVTATKPVALTKMNTSAILNLDTDLNPAPSYSYLILQKAEKDFDLTIQLSNPNDYHIFDFTLTCEDANAKIKLDGTYVDLTSVNSINWKGDTNTKYTISMQSVVTDFQTSIELTSLYFSDRTDGTNRYSADLQNNGLVDIYKVNSGIAYDNLGFGSHKITINDTHVDTTSILVDGAAATFTNNELVVVKDYLVKSINVSYDYILENNTTSSNTITFILATPFEKSFVWDYDLNGKYTTKYSIDLKDTYFSNEVEYQYRIIIKPFAQDAATEYIGQEGTTINQAFTYFNTITDIDVVNTRGKEMVRYEILINDVWTTIYNFR